MASESSTPKTIIAFDLYGTLLSTSSIATTLSSLLSLSPEKAKEVAELWRRYQLEYTWRLNSMKIYKTFSEVTLASLQHALWESGVVFSQTQEDTLSNLIMEAYDSLHTFPDAQEGLELLRKFENSIDAYIFSNGTSSMISNSVNNSTPLSLYSTVFKGLISIDDIQLFKPAPEAYHHFARQTGKISESKEDMKSIWLVSSNPFDIVGAKSSGMKACWVDRIGKGWCDSVMGEEGKPEIIVTGVSDAVRGIEGWGEGK